MIAEGHDFEGLNRHQMTSPPENSSDYSDNRTKWSGSIKLLVEAFER